MTLFICRDRRSELLIPSRSPDGSGGAADSDRVQTSEDVSGKMKTDFIKNTIRLGPHFYDIYEMVMDKYSLT